MQIEHMPVDELRAYPNNARTHSKRQVSQLPKRIGEDGHETKGAARGPEGDVPEDAAGPAVTRIGDVGVLGRHRVLGADAREQNAYATLLEGAKAEFVFTDPPYNVAIDGNVCGLG